MKHVSFSVKLLILLTVVYAGLSFVSRASAQDEGWQIVRADYGYRGQRTDVTDLLRNLISRGGVNGRVAVNNQTMGGDPAVGKDKNLHILARNRTNEQREFDFREGSSIDVGLFANRNDDWDERDQGRGRDRDSRGLFIIRGYYGVQGRTVNVTDRLRSMMRGGTLSINVNNEMLGGDPAIGADKMLIVIYRFRGEEQATFVREGNRLTLP